MDGHAERALKKPCGPLCLHHVVAITSPIASCPLCANHLNLIQKNSTIGSHRWGLRKTVGTMTIHVRFSPKERLRAGGISLQGEITPWPRTFRP